MLRQLTQSRASTSSKPTYPAIEVWV